MPISGYERSIYVTYLRTVPMFAHCTAAEIDKIAALATPRSVKPGEAIVREGEPGNEFFVLCTGEVEVVRGRRVVAKLEEGAFFGEIALFADEPRDATVNATIPSNLEVLSRADFEKLLGDIPSIRDQVLRGMARRLHELDGKC
jgi:CRP/FNR family transcriptional regulator, cyclic AMP receptor protein